MKEIKDFKELSQEELLAYCEKHGSVFDADTSKDELIKFYLINEFKGFTKADLAEEADRRGYSMPTSYKRAEAITALVESIVADYIDEIAARASEEAEADGMTAEPEEVPAPDGLPEGEIDLQEMEQREQLAETAAPPKKKEENKEPSEKPVEKMDKKELAKMADALLKENREEEKRQSKSALERAAREERRKTQARISEATTRLSENEDIEMRAYGDDADLRPRQIRNAPKSLSVSGERLVISNIGEEDDLDLVESYNNPAYIPSGIVTDLTKKREFYAENPKTGEKQKFVNVSAIVRYGERDVLIPAVYFFEDYYSMDQDKVLEYMQGRLMSEVDFRVVKIDRDDPKNPIYTGSRIAAMRKKRCDYWYSDRQQGRKLLEPDSVHEARIVAVTKALIYVELFGAEFPIYTSEIAHHYISDVRVDTDYAPGDTETVKLTSVTLQDRKRAAALGWPVACEGSIKATIEDTTEAYLLKLREGSYTIGRVTNVRIGKNDTLDIYVNNGRIDIFCRLGYGIAKRPKEGDTVQIKIKRVDVPERFVFGYIQHITPAKIGGRRR